MCESNEHAGCELGQLQADYPSWEFADDGEWAKAYRGGVELAWCDDSGRPGSRFGRLRNMLVRWEAGQW